MSKHNETQDHTKEFGGIPTWICQFSSREPFGSAGND